MPLRRDSAARVFASDHLGTIRPRNQVRFRSLHPYLPALVEIVKDNGLGLGHLLDCVARPFLSYAAILEASIWHQVGSPQRSPVNHHIAAFDGARKAQGLTDVARKYPRAQPILAVI